MRAQNENVIFISPAAAEFDLRRSAAEKAEAEWNRALSSQEVNKDSNVAFIHGGKLYKDARRAKADALDRAWNKPDARDMWLAVAEGHDSVLRSLGVPGFAGAVRLENEAVNKATLAERQGLPVEAGIHRGDVEYSRGLQRSIHRSVRER